MAVLLKKLDDPDAPKRDPALPLPKAAPVSAFALLNQYGAININRKQ